MENHVKTSRNEDLRKRRRRKMVSRGSRALRLNPARTTWSLARTLYLSKYHLQLRFPRNDPNLPKQFPLPKILPSPPVPRKQTVSSSSSATFHTRPHRRKSSHTSPNSHPPRSDIIMT